MLETQIKQNTAAVEALTAALERMADAMANTPDTPPATSASTSDDITPAKDEAPDDTPKTDEITDEITDGDMRDTIISITKRFDKVEEGRHAVIETLHEVNHTARRGTDLDQSERAQFIQLAKDKGLIDA